VLDGAAGVDRITVFAAVGAMVVAGAGCWEFVRREIG